MGFRLIFLEENMCKESNEMLNKQMEEAIIDFIEMNTEAVIVDIISEIR